MREVHSVHQGVRELGVGTADSERGPGTLGQVDGPAGAAGPPGRGAEREGVLAPAPTCEWMCVCCSRLTTWPKVLPQTSQAKGRVPLWERRACTSSPWGVEKTWGWGGPRMRPRGAAAGGPFPRWLGFLSLKWGWGVWQAPGRPSRAEQAA